MSYAKTINQHALADGNNTSTSPAWMFYEDCALCIVLFRAVLNRTAPSSGKVHCTDRERKTLCLVLQTSQNDNINQAKCLWIKINRETNQNWRSFSPAYSQKQKQNKTKQKNGGGNLDTNLKEKSGENFIQIYINKMMGKSGEKLGGKPRIKTWCENWIRHAYKTRTKHRLFWRGETEAVYFLRSFKGCTGASA